MRDRKNDKYRAKTEKRLGRKLGTNEVVDHIDEDKTNDADSNLRVKPRGAHSADHNRGRKVSALKESLRMHRQGKKLY